jgi:hypothetical protein
MSALVTLYVSDDGFWMTPAEVRDHAPSGMTSETLCFSSVFNLHRRYSRVVLELPSRDLTNHVVSRALERPVRHWLTENILD